MNIDIFHVLAEVDCRADTRETSAHSDHAHRAASGNGLFKKGREAGCLGSVAGGNRGSGAGCFFTDVSGVEAKAYEDGTVIVDVG